MWPFVTNTTSAIEFVMLITCVLMGASHVVQPRIWSAFFEQLREKGVAGLVANSFINSVPGAVIVALHQVWAGPAVLLTMFGWLLLIKAAIGLWLPAVGLRSLNLSRHGDTAFRAAGVGLLVVALGCALQLGGVLVPAG